MKLRIRHETRYDYEYPVELNPHSILLKPLQRTYFDVENYRLDIDPVPQGINERYTIEGNPFYQVWFNGLTDKLLIQTSFDVTIKEFNPFSFIIDLDFLENIRSNEEIFFHYHPNDHILLSPYLLSENNAILRGFADRVFFNNPDNPINYWMELLSEIHATWKHIIREEENLWSPEKTFVKKEGSCRDLSWMLIHMLRMQGLASRFVSGYAYNSELAEGHELHAWVEAYLPGAGWTGMDPSLGLLADENYIPLACSSDAQNTLPVHGKYGGEAKAKLHSYVEITQC